MVVCAVWAGLGWAGLGEDTRDHEVAGLPPAAARDDEIRKCVVPPNRRTCVMVRSRLQTCGTRTPADIIDLCFQYTDTELVTDDCYLEYVIIKHNSCTRSLIMGPKCTQVSSVVSKIETFGRKNN